MDRLYLMIIGFLMVGAAAFATWSMAQDDSQTGMDKGTGQQSEEQVLEVGDPAKNPIYDPQISIFHDGLVKAGLGDIFIGTGSFTAFAPSNEAFQKLGKKQLEELFKSENQDRLAYILNYHIVHGKYMSPNLRTRTLKAINGKMIDVKTINGKTTVNNANLIRTDMVGPHGVIHVIDTVLIP